MLTDRQILEGIYRIVNESGLGPKRLREMGIHATVGYQKPAHRTYWLKLPCPDPEGLLWIGMPRKSMERCVILGGFSPMPKPTLGRILRTVGRRATYAYSNIMESRREIARGRRKTVLSKTISTSMSQDGNSLVFEEFEVGDKPISIPNGTRTEIPDAKELSILIPGMDVLVLCDSDHRVIPNPFKAGK